MKSPSQHLEEMELEKSIPSKRRHSINIPNHNVPHHNESEEECNHSVDDGKGWDENFDIPDEVYMKRIVAKAENYFSDENLCKDVFLMKHIRKNKEGFVNLKLVASLRKIKILTNNWKVVAYSIKQCSSKLEINESYDRIRRIDPIPDSVFEMIEKILASKPPESEIKAKKPLRKTVSAGFDTNSELSGWRPRTRSSLISRYHDVDSNDRKNRSRASSVGTYSTASSTQSIPELTVSHDTQPTRKGSGANDYNSAKTRSGFFGLKKQNHENLSKRLSSGEEEKRNNKEERNNKEGRRPRAKSIDSFKKPAHNQSKRLSLGERIPGGENEDKRPRTQSNDAKKLHNQLAFMSIRDDALEGGKVVRRSRAHSYLTHHSNQIHLPTISENIIRSPRGPDGTKGFEFGRPEEVRKPRSYSVV